MGVNTLAAAQGRAASPSWSAGTARKRFSAEASTGDVACISSAAARPTMRDRRFFVRLSRRQAAAAVPSGFRENGETLPLKCGCRLCVCCVHGPCEPLFTGSSLLLCSACMMSFPGVTAAAIRLTISRAWSGEYTWTWQIHRLLRSTAHVVRACELCATTAGVHALAVLPMHSLNTCRAVAVRAEV